MYLRRKRHLSHSRGPCESVVIKMCFLIYRCREPGLSGGDSCSTGTCSFLPMRSEPTREYEGFLRELNSFSPKGIILFNNPSQGKDCSAYLFFYYMCCRSKHCSAYLFSKIFITSGFLLLHTYGKPKINNFSHLLLHVWTSQLSLFPVPCVKKNGHVGASKSSFQVVLKPF